MLRQHDVPKNAPAAVVYLGFSKLLLNTYLGFRVYPKSALMPLVDL